MDLLALLVRCANDPQRSAIVDRCQRAGVAVMENGISIANEGRAVLYGSLDEIKSRYAEHAVILDCDQLPDGLAGVQRVEQHNRAYELILEPVDGDVGIHQLAEDYMQAERDLDVLLRE